MPPRTNHEPSIPQPKFIIHNTFLSQPKHIPTPAIIGLATQASNAEEVHPLQPINSVVMEHDIWTIRTSLHRTPVVMSRPGPFLSTRGGINHPITMAASDALSRLVGAVVGYVPRLVALAHPAPTAAPHGFDHILGAHLEVNTTEFTKRLDVGAG